MKNEAKKSADYDALCQLIRKSKELSSDRKDQLIWACYGVPKSKREITENEVDEWLIFHQHPDKYKGAIGGHITKSECFTSIGDLVTYTCSMCGKAAFITDSV